jgi:hypothetical protein
MKTNVEIEVPLSGLHSAINLPGPCTYCGGPVDPSGAHEWQGKRTYNLKQWAVGQRSGTTQLFDLKIGGEIQRADVTVHAPYCAQHAERVKLFVTTLAVSLVVGLVAAVVALGLIYAQPGESMVDEIQDLFLIGGLLIAGVGSGYLLGWGLNSLIALVKPEYRDYPKALNGHWGLSVGAVRVDSGERFVGPVRYFLPLRFVSAESARRFLAAYPAAAVTKGAELLAE